jgi:AhpD family alkylhydroperoxidase
VTSFDESTPSAPAARRVMTATANHLGYLPAATARWASSPQLLDGFQKLSGLFDTTTLDPVAREVVIMTIATRNGCHLCVAMHTARRAGPARLPRPRLHRAQRARGRPGIGTYVMSTLANRLTGAPVDDQVSAFA